MSRRSGPRSGARGASEGSDSASANEAPPVQPPVPDTSEAPPAPPDTSDERPLGWRPERPGSALLLGARATPLRALSSHGGIDREDWLVWQKGESCFGHLIAQFAWLLKGIKGSPYFSWWAARLHDFPGVPLFDTGVTASAGLKAMRTHGVCKWEHWNPSVEGFDLNAEPSGLAPIGARKMLAKAWPLAGSGSELAQRAAGAIDEGHPVGVVVAVDSVLDAYDSGVLGREAGPNRGYHIMVASRFRVSQSGKLEIGGVNTWRGWGLEGRYWMSAERFGQSPFVIECAGFQ